jgi:PAS domain S-box-containing protein
MNSDRRSSNDSLGDLQGSDTRLQQVLDYTSALVFAKDSQGRYLFINREFERISGRRSAEIIGRRDEEIFPPELATRFRHNDLRVLQERRAIEFEEEADFGDGLRTFLSSKFPLFDLNGLAYAVCGMATDITDRKRLEAALSAAALAVSQSDEDALYRQLVRYLSTILGVDGAFVATYDSRSPDQLTMLAFFLDGEIRENFAYSQADTPCQTVIGQSLRVYPARLRELFPGDDEFKELGIESYAGHPLTDGQGRPAGLIAVLSRRPLERPVFVESVLKIFAVRVNAEFARAASAQALRTSEASYREIFEASDDAIFVHDWETGAVLDVNPRACEIYGYRREELLATRIGDLGSGVSPYTEADALRWIDQAKRDGSVNFEWHRRNRDGTLHWDEVRLKSAKIAGQPRILAIIREITAAKEREQELRQGEDRLRATLTAALDCIIVTDHAGRIIEFNPAAEACFGHTRESVLGRRLIEALIPVHLQAEVEHDLARYFATGAAAPLRQRMELMALRADGTEFSAELAIGAAQGPEGPIFIGYLRDISERKAAEEKRLQLESRLRQAQKMEAIGQLTGGIAHDFNNLLTSITGYVVLASERPSAATDPRLQGYLAHAQRSCERARDLIQQMLVFSRGGQGSPCTLRLQPLLVDSLPSVRAVLPPGMPMTLDVDDASATLVHVDPLQAEQVLLNLCLNARDAMGTAGELRVGLRGLIASGLVCSGCGAPVDGPYVELAVADTGHGIAPETMQRMFDPFFSTKAAGKGTGMGLAIVHGIVHEHGGHVVVETRIGAGSCFRILWPAIATESGTDESLETSDKAAAPPRTPLSGHVLLVDDDASVAGFMRDLLETNGLEVTCASSGDAALHLVSSAPRRFDAVITDQVMPGKSGLDVAREIRALRDDLPVILYTGYGDGLAGHNLQAAGLHAVLHKPVDPATLFNALAKALPMPGVLRTASAAAP